MTADEMNTQSLEQRLGYEIARVRHGQSVTASDLANRLMPFIEAVRAEEREKAAQIADWSGGTESVYIAARIREQGS